MQREITYHYSEALTKTATRYFIWRCAGPMLARFGMAGALAIVLATVPGMDDRWRLAAAALLIIVVPLGLVGWNFRSFRRCRQPGDKLPNGRIVVRLDPDTITFETEEDSLALKWTDIHVLWRFPEVFLLIVSLKPPAFLTLPTVPLDSELRRFIEDKVRDHGGDVN